MHDITPLLPDKQRATKETVDGLTVRADELMAAGQWGDAAERFEQAAQSCKEMAWDLDRTKQLARIRGVVA